MRKWTKAYGGMEGERERAGRRKVRKRRQERERKKTLVRKGDKERGRER